MTKRMKGIVANGNIIDYGDALLFYGAEGLVRNIWKGEKYLSFVEKYTNTN